jgi:hypothetical protein
MATEINLTAMEPRVFGAQVREGDADTSHRIHTSQDILEMLQIEPDDVGSQELLVRETLLFLLERENATEILSEFTLDQVASFFPEYSTEIADRFNAVT